MKPGSSAAAACFSSSSSLVSRPPPSSFSRGEGVKRRFDVCSRTSCGRMADPVHIISFNHKTPKVRGHLLNVAAEAGGSTDDAYVSAEDEHTSGNHHAGGGGPFPWLRNILSRRTAQKEELVNGLKRYGVAGILSYGLLNTAYYLTTFLFVWFYVAPSPGGIGFVPAAKRFFQVFATVWAGSQVTKLLRAAGALSLAPFVDRGLNWYTRQFNFESRGKAFSFLVGACFGLAALVFLLITSLWS